MATSAVEGKPFELAREMRSVCVTNTTRTNETIKLLVMDKQNCNEVLAFILCDVSTGKLHCSDRENRRIFAAECGIRIANKKEITVSIKSSETGFSHCGGIKHLDSDLYQVDNMSVGDNDANCKLLIQFMCCDGDGVYTVTNELLDEVCVMRSERSAMHIIYFQSMNDNGKLLLLAFSVKHLFKTFHLAYYHISIPHVEISTMTPDDAFCVRSHKDIPISMIDDIKHPSTNMSSLKEAAFHCAGYDKTLGIQYYDIYDTGTGITQLTFEVWRDKEPNITAILKDCYGSTVMTALDLRQDCAIMKISKETFTFEAFNNLYAKLYDEDRKLVFAVRKNKKVVNRRLLWFQYKFFHPENSKGKIPPHATMKCTRSGLPTIVFNDPDLNHTRKALILTVAMRVSILYFYSHTLVMPLIDYCYIKKPQNMPTAKAHLP